MIYKILAILVETFHLGYVSYVVLGQLLIVLGGCFRWAWVRNRWFRLTHVSAIVIVAFEALISFPCPLTTLENWLNDKHTEGETFIEQLLDRFMAINDVPQYVLDLGYYCFAIVAIVSLFVIPPRWYHKKRRPGLTEPSL